MAMMENYVTILCVIFSAIQEGELELGRTSLRAVSSFPGLDTYYFNLLQTHTFPEISLTEPPSADPSEKKIMKEKLCRKIFTSPLFEKKRVKWIDIDDPHVVQDIAEKNPHFRNFFLPAESSEYTNPYPYQPYSFSRNGVHETDLMFICPVLNEESAHIIPYYVSREYNVNLAPNAEPIVGRFVFSKNTFGDMEIEALAEEPAVGSKVKQKVRFVAEYKYMARRQFDPQRGGPEEMDPVCQLHLRHKIRLCAIIFASKVLRFKYKFTPIRTNVRPQDCIKTRTYDEYMIGCKAERKRKSDQNEVTYYVSRGLARNTVFVYKEKSSDGRIFVKHYLRNVSVVNGIRAEEIGERTLT